MSKKNTETVKVYKKKCPICNRPTIDAESMAEDKAGKKRALWYKCRCGVIFQGELPKKVPEDKNITDALLAGKEYADVAIHPAKVYLPVIEELTYGRRVLDVGFGTEHNMDFLKSRGWIASGIDSNKDIVETGRIIKDDFETTDRLYQKDYDVVWMGMVLEKFHDPINALAKVHSILQQDGVLFMTTPDTDFIYTMPNALWQHWRKDKNYIMWNPRSIKKVLEHLGFDVILLKRNVYQRFGDYFNMHIIAQKVFC